MTFHSILSEKNIQKETAEQPVFFTDLNLDQVINEIAGRRKDYNLSPFFYTPLRDAETIDYRHEVMRDMENKTLAAHINAFSEKMILVRRYLAMPEKLTFIYHKKGWFLEAALIYCEAVAELSRNLESVDLKSRGFLSLREYATHYTQSRKFTALQAEAQKVKADLSAVRYCVILVDGGFKVKRYEDEAEYSSEVEKTFEKFKQGAVRDYLVDAYQGTGMNHIEAKILEFVALLYPEPFAALDKFCNGHENFLDETIRAFDREIQFYAAYLEHVAAIKHDGLAFCYPQVSDSKNVYARETFDIALAFNLRYEKIPIVTNDFELRDSERIIVVTGPNQGGKTTFARTFGQAHYLASLGCPVPGKEARLFLFDEIFTHFEKSEDIHNLRGKLEDDLARIYDIFARATSKSMLIFNEVFSSTTIQDAIFLSEEIMKRALDLDLPCVWVTFIDELASFSEKTVSMVSTVQPDNPAMRTFKIIRKPADGLAYALSIAEKRRLTYAQIKERIQS